MDEKYFGAPSTTIVITMKEYKQYLVNSFAEKGLRGNPAAVCILEKQAGWPDVADMQAIAKVNNLSETAFCLPIVDDALSLQFEIRWFTPGCEVDLCGHATLATAYILFLHYFPHSKQLCFNSRSGRLTVTKDADFILTMDFPAYSLTEVTERDEIEAVKNAIGEVSYIEIYKGIDYVVVFENEDDVISFKPDFNSISALPGSYNLLITAAAAKEKNKGKRPFEYDFLSRCFFPKEAINEDPVTGSAHSSLAPLWASKLGKNKLTAYQASERGGLLHLQFIENEVSDLCAPNNSPHLSRVQIGGLATTE